MLVYEFKLDGNQKQFAAIEEAIHVVQFIRNKCLRLWMDGTNVSKNDLQTYCAVLARKYPFASRLNSQARQASADRAWFGISRFYEHCKNKKPGKKGYPQFQHNNRSVEYKKTGWKLDDDGRHITFTDGCGIGRLRLVGNKKQKIETFPVKDIKRVRIVRRADGYYCQFSVKTERNVFHVSTGREVGIDVGLKAYLTDSEGNTVENPRHYRKAEKKLKRLQRMRNILAALLEKLPDDLKASEEAKMLRSAADHKVYNIVHLIYRSKHYEGHSKDYEFSRLTMEDHWRAGYHDAVRTLRHEEVLERPSHLEGVFTFDLAQASRE